MPDDLFALPQNIRSIADCYFYHTMSIPGLGVVEGEWDLRDGVDAYLGGTQFSGKRVLEVGPASGFLTIEMEKRGASVVALEVLENPGWDFVPYPDSVMAPILGPRREKMRRLRNSFWFVHAKNDSRAKLLFADAYDMPDEIGTFDIALLGAVLLHTRAPLQIVEQCARRAKTIIITDLLHPQLEGSPVCRLHPTAENQEWDTWWAFSSDFFVQFLRVLGFSTEVTTHTQQCGDKPADLFTVVATRA